MLQAGLEKSPFQLFPISANRLEVNENVNGTRFKHWVVVKWRNEQSYSFRQSPKWAKVDRAHCVVVERILLMTLSV